MNEQAPSDAEIEEYVREAFAGREEEVFVPRLRYDENLDAIRVQVEDTSITELELTPAFTICEKSHRELDGLFHVGFVVEGARIFCKEHGLPYTGKVRMDAILNLVMEIEPGSRSAVLDIAIPMIEEYGLTEVEFPS
jgi:hypothetical protein